MFGASALVLGKLEIRGEMWYDVTSVTADRWMGVRSQAMGGR